jgi:RNase P subunit RPR2
VRVPVPVHQHRSKSNKALPIVRCPGCETAMIPSPPEKLPRISSLQEITYTCPSCGMTTRRTIKAGS